MQLRPSRPLSVIGAMKDIAEYKITKAKADEAPTLVERAKLQLEWDKEDRPYDLSLKKQSVKKGEQDIAKTAMEIRAAFLSDIVNFSKWISEGETPEEKQKRIDIARQQITEKYEDEVTSTSPDAVAGDLIPPKLDEAQISRIADLAGEELVKLGKSDRLVHPKTGEVKVDALKDDPKTAMEAFLRNNPNASNEEIANFARLLQKPSSALTLEERKELEKYKAGLKKDRPGTGPERDRALRMSKLDEYRTLAKENPNNAYEKGIRLEDDGTVYLDAYGAPEILPPAHEVLGKRSMVNAIMQAGEHYDDAVELKELLKDPEVAANLKKAEDSGYWDRTKGTWNNRIFKYLRGLGITEDSKTATAIGRMQMMASIERKKYLGSAVTIPELKTITTWLPEANDSYDTMVNKINLIAKEGEQAFTRFLDFYKNQGNMTPFYKAFGIKRFSEGGTTENDRDAEFNRLMEKYGKK